MLKHTDIHTATPAYASLVVSVRGWRVWVSRWQAASVPSM